MLVSGSRDHSVRLWDASSMQPICVLEPIHYDAVLALAAVGSALFTGGADRAIKHWSVF